MATYTELSGATVKNFKIQKGTDMSFPLDIKDADNVPVSLASSTFVFQVYRGNYSVLFEITDGELSDDNYTITFTKNITTAIGNYKYRILRTLDGVTQPVMYGRFKIY